MSDFVVLILPHLLHIFPLFKESSAAFRLKYTKLYVAVVVFKKKSTFCTDIWNLFWFYRKLKIINITFRYVCTLVFFFVVSWRSKRNTNFIHYTSWHQWTKFISVKLMSYIRFLFLTYVHFWKGYSGFMRRYYL